MSGVHLTTISPSRTSSRRSTPCVDGCCGPNEMVICVSSGRSTTSNAGGRFVVDALMPCLLSTSLLFEHEFVCQHAAELGRLAILKHRREACLLRRCGGGGSQEWMARDGRRRRN